MSRRNFPPLKTSIKFTVVISDTTKGTLLYMFRCTSALTGTKLNINWGDGITETMTAPTNSAVSTSTINHTFAAAGTYNVRLTDNNGTLNFFTFQSGAGPVSPVVSMDELIMPNATDVSGFSYRTNTLLRVSYDLFNYSPKLTALNKVFQENTGIRTPATINQLRFVNNLNNLYQGANRLGLVAAGVLTADEKLYIENTILNGYLGGLNKVTDVTLAFRIRTNSSGDTPLVLNINNICSGFTFENVVAASQMFSNNINNANKIYTTGNVQALLTNANVKISKLNNVKGMFEYCPSLTGDFYPVEQRLLNEAPLLNKSAIDSTFGGWGMVAGCTGLTYNGQPFSSIPGRWRGV